MIQAFLKANLVNRISYNAHWFGCLACGEKFIILASADKDYWGGMATLYGTEAKHIPTSPLFHLDFTYLKRLIILVHIYLIVLLCLLIHMSITMLCFIYKYIPISVFLSIFR